MLRSDCLRAELNCNRFILHDEVCIIYYENMIGICDTHCPLLMSNSA
eukprot:COSAG01_NODE_405_length_17466_cov_554.403697_14_plen_47_part_00